MSAAMAEAKRLEFLRATRETLFSKIDQQKKRMGRIEAQLRERGEEWNKAESRISELRHALSEIAKDARAIPQDGMSPMAAACLRAIIYRCEEATE